MDVTPPPDAPPLFISRQGSGTTPVVRNKLQVVHPVAENVFTGKPLHNIGFSIGQVLVLVEYSYNTVDTVL